MYSQEQKETAKRELQEETGAVKFVLEPLCVYSVIGKTRANESGEEFFGLLCFAENIEFSGKLESEIEKVELMDELPENRTYPLIQPNKQPVIWRTLCETIENDFAGDIRKLFCDNDYSAQKVKVYIAKNKKKFPYLGGNKICNYWLYVMEQYTDVKFIDRDNITVAPDTHVIQASERLGVISLEETGQSGIQEIVASRWQEILKGTDLVPIDVHTPMWLWSRGKFEVEI